MTCPPVLDVVGPFLASLAATRPPGNGGLSPRRLGKTTPAVPSLVVFPQHVRNWVEDTAQPFDRQPVSLHGRNVGFRGRIDRLRGILFVCDFRRVLAPPVLSALLPGGSLRTRPRCPLLFLLTLEKRSGSSPCQSSPLRFG